MSFTILLDEPSLERVALPYVQLLQKLGIDARVRTVDPAQYQHLTDDFDFDMIMMIYPEGDIPGNELRDYFTCAARQGAGQLQRPGHLRSGGGCAGREDRHGAGPRHADDRGARAGPGAAVALVPGAELGQPNVPHRLLGPLRPSRTSRSARGSTSTPGGSMRQRPRRSTRRRHSDAARTRSQVEEHGSGRPNRPCTRNDRLPAPPAAAGDPDAVRHHRHQLRGDPVRARRTRWSR